MSAPAAGTVLTLLMLPLLYVNCEVARHDSWDMSSGEFSLRKELAQGDCSTIVVPYSHSVAAEFPEQHAPLQLDRNVTLTGAQGLDTVLDLAFLHGVVQLCVTCVFTITNITLTNERKGFGGLIDFFVGQPSGSIIIRVHDAQRLRLACTSAEANAEVVSQTPRSKVLPGADRPQVPSIGDITWNGRTWPDTLMNRDFTVDVPYAKEEGGHLEGGYALDIKRMQSLCEQVASAACLAKKEPQVCIEETTEQVLAAKRAAAAVANDGRAQPAAVAVPAVCAVLLAWAGVGFVLWWRHRRTRPKEDSATAPDAATAAAAAKVAVAGSVTTVLASTADCSAAEDGWDVEMGLLRHQQQQQHVVSCSSTRDGWVLVHSVTSPAIDVVKGSSIHFGELLGAGSFGRVYRGRWNSMDVAVKVIEHDASAALEVENEVLLLMGLQHECIVAAYQYARYVPSDAAPGVLAAAAAASGEASCISSGSRASANGLSRGLSNGRGSGSTERTNSKPGSAKRKAESHLVMELCDCGTLTHTVDDLLSLQRQRQQQQQQQAGRGVPVQVLLLLRDVTRGLQAIHNRNIVHGDLNARNVLVRSNAAAPSGLTAKLADFGLSRAMRQNTHRTTKTCGTLSHMPPEVLKEGRMSPAMDFFWFGVMMWEVATGSAAFKGLHYAGFYKAIVLQGLRPRLPPGMPAGYAALMQQCWAAQPGDRPTASQLLESLEALIAAAQASSSTS